LIREYENSILIREYFYDQYNRVQKTILYNDSGKYSGNEIYTYFFDTLLHRIREFDTAGNEISYQSFEYNVERKLERYDYFQLYRQTNDFVGKKCEIYEYNRQGKLQQISYCLTDTSVINRYRIFEYDSFGMVSLALQYSSDDELDATIYYRFDGRSNPYHQFLPFPEQFSSNIQYKTFFQPDSQIGTDSYWSSFHYNDEDYPVREYRDIANQTWVLFEYEYACQ